MVLTRTAGASSRAKLMARGMGSRLGGHVGGKLGRRGMDVDIGDVG